MKVNVTFSSLAGRAGVTGLAMVLLAGTAFAQSVYRNVDKNGKVTFSDQPQAAATAPAAPRAGGASGATGAGLPYEIRQVAQRYPVTIYTSDDCAPCGPARSLLLTRGVPFEERTVRSSDDIAALQRLSGQTSLPLVSIGSQQLKGFSDTEWSQYLDAAGYPKSAQLPATYRNPPAQPLVAVVQAVVPTAPQAPGVPLPPLPPASNSDATPSNPAGIKF